MFEVACGYKLMSNLDHGNYTFIRYYDVSIVTVSPHFYLIQRDRRFGGQLESVSDIISNGKIGPH